MLARLCNMSAVALKRLGRPAKYSTPEEMMRVAYEYFEDCKIHGEPLTVTGLAIALNLTRKSLISYEVKPEFLNTVKRLKSLVENSIENKLLTDSSVAGKIFNLKNNFDWKDTQVVEHKGELDLVLRIRSSRTRGEPIDVTPGEDRALPAFLD